MAGIAMPPDRAGIPAFDFDMRQFGAAADIAHFKTQQAVDGDKGESFFSVDSKGTNEIGKGTHFTNQLMFPGISYMQPGRGKIIEINIVARRAINSIVSSFVHFDLFDDLTTGTIHHVPETFFQRREIHGFSIGGNGHAVAAAFKLFFPNEFIGSQVDAL